MSENIRTLVYVAVAACVLLAAIFTRPRMVDVQSSDAEQEKHFFPALKENPLGATSIEIITYDQDSAQPQAFKVAKVNNVWSIPSHENYPADAERQLGEAAASVMNLERGPVVSDRAVDHETYGVIDPDPKTLKAGATGVGTRVTMEDPSGKRLAQLIVGKADKTDSTLRFVRVPGSDNVYRVKLDTSKLTTKFDSWIEPDLLKLNAFEIQQVTINNYHVDPLTGEIREPEGLKLTYNDTDSKWTLEGMAPDEELAADKLNAMKTALDDLKIVDVHRKPAGLSAALRGEKEGLQQQDLLSLQGHGFYLSNQSGLLCTDGEVYVQMKDGVVYDLKFGGLAAGTGGADDKEKDEEGNVKPTGTNRYIFVLARFEESAIPKPELTPLPTEVQPAPAPAPAEKPATEGGGDLQPGEPAPTAEPAANEPAAKTGTGSATVSGAPDDPQQAERRRIVRENKQKLDEYNEKIEAGKKRVEELNSRFSDWYYVISDDVYQKIHLDRAEIIKQTKSESAVDALDELRKQGIDKPATDPGATPDPSATPGPGLGGPGLGAP
jgi:hypothetical protein